MTDWRRSKVTAAFMILSAFCLPGPLQAQVSSRGGPLIMELPASTAAQAMGGAPYLSRSGADAFFYNPAVLARGRGLAGGAQRYGSRATLLDFAGATEWWGGGVGLGLRSLSYEAPSLAAATAGGSEGALYGRGPEAVSQVAASAGYARRFGALAVGAMGTLVEERVGGRHDAGAALSLGAAAEAGFVTVGLAVRNLGPSLHLGGHSVDLPERIDLGASARGVRAGPLDLGGSALLSRLADGEVAPAVGLELAYWPVVGRTFIARVGLRRVPHGPSGELSFGAAFEGDDIVLEYAYQGADGLKATHRFGIGWR